MRLDGAPFSVTRVTHEAGNEVLHDRDVLRHGADPIDRSGSMPFRSTFLARTFSRSRTRHLALNLAPIQFRKRRPCAESEFVGAHPARRLSQPRVCFEGIDIGE